MLRRVLEGGWQILEHRTKQYAIYHLPKGREWFPDQPYTSPSIRWCPAVGLTSSLMGPCSSKLGAWPLGILLEVRLEGALSQRVLGALLHWLWRWLGWWL